MNKKLIFRIVGALASALIIAGVFVPFISVTGYSTSIWETFSSDSIYLPIMLIVFGVIGVIFFALNFKTEFAYMSTGGVAFFLVMQTIDIINQGVFNTLSVGYYFLVIGTLVTGVMAFLTNLKSKNNDIVQPQPALKNDNMIEQIDKLYDDKSTQTNEISPIQPVNNVVEPIPAIQPINPVVQDSNTPVQNEVQQTVAIPNINPVVQDLTAQNMQSQTPVNPVVQEFANNNVVQSNPNPVVQEFTNNNAVQNNPNPVVQDLTAQNTQVQTPVNPVVQEFVSSNPTPQSSEPNPALQDLMNSNSKPLEPQNTNTNGTDIFGQPINK